MITHGNGPQVGNLLVKNELAAAVVPPVPLDWCGAQTQATLGFVLMDALDDALAARGVDAAHGHRGHPHAGRRRRPGLRPPTKPIGRFLPAEEAALLVEHGETWEDRGEKGWRRVVASPEPLEILDAPAVQALIEAGFVVVANGGGGIPVVRDATAPARRRGRHRQGPRRRPAGPHRRCRRARHRHRRAARRAPLRHARGRADVGTVTVDEMRAYAAEGHFASGSMGPKVDAACRFVEHGGSRAVITDLAHIAEAVAGDAGTVVVPTRTTSNLRE